MGIHLAAEGFKVEGFFGRHSNPEYIVNRGLFAENGIAEATVHF
jgi:hypothetical protein